MRGNYGCDQTKLFWNVSIFISLASVSEFILCQKLTVASMKGSTATDTHNINSTSFLMTLPD